jgi:hypothetical protein
VVKLSSFFSEKVFFTQFAEKTVFTINLGQNQTDQSAVAGGGGSAAPWRRQERHGGGGSATLPTFMPRYYILQCNAQLVIAPSHY